MDIKISDKIKKLIPELKLGIYEAEVIYEKTNKKLWDKINEEITRISGMDINKVKDIPQIASSREAYKRLGKEPARYRLSAEALHRRIIKGKGLYKISNIVDAINLASIMTGYSIGGYDSEKIQGNIMFDIGSETDEYEAIGRGQMNIANLPVFKDAGGPFGSPTSDSVRTMITPDTTKILLIVINFGGHPNFADEMKSVAHIFRQYCEACNDKIYYF